MQVKNKQTKKNEKENVSNLSAGRLWALGGVLPIKQRMRANAENHL